IADNSSGVSTPQLVPLAGIGTAGPSTYYIAPTSGGGSDSNDGLTTGTPWLSPNHPVNCGDVLSAAVGTYASANFYNGKWGAVTCSAGNNVAWVKCATAFGCTITDTSQSPMF